MFGVAAWSLMLVYVVRYLWWSGRRHHSQRRLSHGDERGRLRLDCHEHHSPQHRLSPGPPTLSSQSCWKLIFFIFQCDEDDYQVESERTNSLSVRFRVSCPSLGNSDGRSKFGYPLTNIGATFLVAFPPVDRSSLESLERSLFTSMDRAYVSRA